MHYKQNYADKTKTLCRAVVL